MSGPRPAPAAWRWTDEIVALGRRLLEGKGQVTQSERARALGVAAASATNYMRIAEFWGDRLSDQRLEIDLGALIVLADSRVPQHVRDEVIERAKRGERVTRKLAEALRFAGGGK